jgi:hypothetical protein
MVGRGGVHFFFFRMGIGDDAAGVGGGAGRNACRRS